MFKSLWDWVLTNVFKVKTQTTNQEIINNDQYVSNYKTIDKINFNAIFGNKLANYIMNDSTINVEGNNKRSELLNGIAQQVWKKGKKITSMALGTGGTALVPYAKNGKLYFNIVEQNRITIDSMDGNDITGATVLSEVKSINNMTTVTRYLRWTNYKIENSVLIITQNYTNEEGRVIPVPEFWADIKQEVRISGVEKVAVALLKSSKDNRRTDDKYGVPITYGSESTIEEIRECLRQIAREFELKNAFVGTDITMFKKDANGKYNLAQDGLYKTFNTGKDDFWQVFSPDIRESSYYARLKELYERLETEVGTSRGMLTRTETQNATATEIKMNMYDTFTIMDDMRTNIEETMDNFLYSCNVIANALNLSPMGDYEVQFDWDYSLMQDNQESFNELTAGVDKGVISKAELRNWIKPSETMEESEMAVSKIKEENPSVQDLLGTNE